MISIIAGTNLPHSKAAVLAHFLELQSPDSLMLDLATLDNGFIHEQMYSRQAPELTAIQKEFLIEPDKWIFIVPEYNGTFPGYLKLFLDACSVHDYQNTFKNKKIWLIGLGSGRGGNLRGLDHLTTAMNYLGCIIFPNRLAISQINSKIKDTEIHDDELLRELELGLKQFLDF
ncbi:MAG TPA: NAD(P)H-dependent oxidoreductase [Saprospiraceae bacterium]|nr:NAD(P)H-dependent oxidoreductase [Saprospiraceae bacterium]